jgi:predicted nucleotidyltransferase
MTKNSLDLSGKIDPVIVEILELIGNVAAECNIPFFIVGATARDVVFNLLHDIAPRRLTLDLDLGIQIAAWESYDKLLGKIVKTGHFIKASTYHRLSQLAIDMMKKNNSSENEYENKLQLIKDFKTGFYLPWPDFSA